MSAFSATVNQKDVMNALKMQLALVIFVVVVAYLVAISTPIFDRSGGQQFTINGTRVFSPAELVAAATARRAALQELPSQMQEPPATLPPLLLVIIGEVYDVSAGRVHYDSGTGYEGFCNGSDVSRAFLTADFEKNATDDLDDLKPGECLGISGWARFYANHSNYTFAGLMHGRFYNASGAPTDALRRFRECLGLGLAAKEVARAAADAAPACGKSSPPPQPMYAHGKWTTFTCAAPLTPRRIVFPGERGDVCACLPAKGDPAWDPTALGLADDPELPQPYNRQDCIEASSCTVRLA